MYLAVKKVVTTCVAVPAYKVLTVYAPDQVVSVLKTHHPMAYGAAINSKRPELVCANRSTPWASKSRHRSSVPIQLIMVSQDSSTGIVKRAVTLTARVWGCLDCTLPPIRYPDR